MRFSLMLCLGLLAGAARAAAPATVPRVQPERIDLSGPRDRVQLVVSGRGDLTATARYEAHPPGLVAVEGGLVRPLADGSGEIVVHAAGHTIKVPFASKASSSTAVSFRHEVIAAFNVTGCNAGACHGTPSGKGGLKFSLRGFDPETDFLTLTRDALNRRVNPLNAPGSLIVQKGAGKVPHEGGVKLKEGELPSRIVLDWIRHGLADDPKDLPAVKSLEVTPGPRVLYAPDNRQQLAVRARFTYGSSRDVTRLTVFSSSDDGVATVDGTGLVTFHRGGEVAILTRYLETVTTVRLTHVDSPEGFRWEAPAEHNFIDTHVFAKLKLLAIPPSGLSSDTEFLRRVTLDLLGVLPTPDEVEAFLADSSKDKRERLVARLLERPEYADFWSLKWADVLAGNRRAVQAKGAYLLHRWLHRHLSDNTPFDRVARELLTATGSTFLNAPANYYRNDRKVRPPDDLAQNTAQLFLGVRLSCAKCHNHPFERWTQDDYHGLAAFFARVRGEFDPLHPRLNRFNLGALDIQVARSGEVIHPRTGKPVAPSFPGGKPAVVKPGQDRREVLAAWLTAEDNPFFARAAVNRVWYHLLGRGIVDQVDDFRDSNPASSEELLDALARDFIRSGYDVKRLIRTILASRTYQLASSTTPLNRDDERYFSHTQVRLHSAEVLLDALSSASDVPEVFPGMKAGTRATQLPDGDVYKHPFLKAFGQPARETVCECERNGDTSLGHALHLVNGPTLKTKLAEPDNRIGRLLAAGRSDEQIVRQLYLATLSRPPSAEERAATLALIRDEPDRRKAWEDVLWALINTKEFLFRH